MLVSEWSKLLELPELARCEHQFQGCFVANSTTDVQGLACLPPSPSSSTSLMSGSWWIDCSNFLVLQADIHATCACVWRSLRMCELEPSALQKLS